MNEKSLRKKYRAIKTKKLRLKAKLANKRIKLNRKKLLILDLQKQLSETEERRQKEIREEIEAARETEQRVYETTRKQVWTEFTGVLQDQLKCPVCTDMFVNPVILQCGHTYCKNCIRQCIDEKNKCPLCRSEITTLTDILTLRNFLELASSLCHPEVKVKEEESTITEPSNRDSVEELNTEDSRQALPEVINTLSSASWRDTTNSLIPTHQPSTPIYEPDFNFLTYEFPILDSTLSHHPPPLYYFDTSPTPSPDYIFQFPLYEVSSPENTSPSPSYIPSSSLYTPSSPQYTPSTYN